MPARIEIDLAELVRLHGLSWSWRKIARTMGVSVKVVRSRMIEMGLLPRVKRTDLSGRKFGMLEAKRVVGHNRFGSPIWECVCDCGSTTKVLSVNLLNRTSQRCKGCWVNLIPTDYPAECLVPYWYWSRIYHGAQLREVCLEVSPQQLSELLEAQGFVCALSGRPICFSTQKSTTASLDRKDSSRGYVEGNLQWIHKEFNRFKNNYPQEKFLSMCREITEHFRSN